MLSDEGNVTLSGVRTDSCLGRHVADDSTHPPQGGAVGVEGGIVAAACAPQVKVVEYMSVNADER